MGKKYLWTIVHEHSLGTSTHYFRSAIEHPKNLPTNEKLAELLGIDFEPEEGETFDISRVTIEDLDDLLAKDGEEKS